MAREPLAGRIGALHALLLLVLLAGAWGIRELTSPTPFAHDTPSGPIDAASAWRLRRIALVLSNERLAQSDRFLSFPDEANSTDLPVFDELVAFATRVFVAGRGDVAGALDADEALLLSSARWGPVVATLWLLALFIFLRGSRAGPGLRPLIVTGLFACAPLCASAGRTGALRIELLIALVFVLAALSVRAVLRSRDPLDRLLHALLAGGISGVGLSLSPLFSIAIVAAWIAFLFEILAARGEERLERARAALLFWIAAALVGLIPAIGGPWFPATTGPVAGWIHLWQGLVLAGVLPYALLLARPDRPVSPRRWAWGLGVVGALAVIALVTGGVESDRTALILCALGWDRAGPRFEGIERLGPEVVWFAVFLVLVVRRELGQGLGERLFLATSGVLGGVAVLFHPPALAILAVPVGQALVHGSSRSPRLERGILILSITWCASLLAMDRARPDREGQALVGAAGWLRTQTEAPCSWNSVHVRPSWGVLTDGRAAPLVAWHGRRPCASPGARRNGEGGDWRRLEASLRASTAAELGAAARAAGIAYILLGPGSARRLARLGVRVEAIEALRGAPGRAIPGVTPLWSSSEDPETAVVLLGLVAPE